MTTDQELCTSGGVRQEIGHVDMAILEAQMLSLLLSGDVRRAILAYHDAMAVDLTEARAVTKVLANMHGVRFRAR